MVEWQHCIFEIADGLRPIVPTSWFQMCAGISIGTFCLTIRLRRRQWILSRCCALILAACGQ
jgi:hypothetical protein